MKKSLIALAVAAGSIAAAQADTTTLYGSLGFSSVIGQTSELTGSVGSQATNTLKSVKDTHWDIAKSTAKIGVKGTEDLNNGMQAFFKFEFGADMDSGLNKTGYAYLGLKGDFGTFTIGKQKSLFKTVTDTGVFQEVGIGYGSGATSYPGTVKKAISYVSPESAGLQFGASVIADNANFASKGADVWEVAAMYKVNGFDTGIVYSHAGQGVKQVKNGKVEAKSTGAQEFIGLNVGYSTDQYNVVGRVTHESSVATEYGIEGEYFTGPNTIRAGFGIHDPKASGAKNTYKAALGYQYNFSDRTYTWVEGEYTDYNSDRDNGFKALVGIRHDF